MVAGKGATKAIWDKGLKTNLPEAIKNIPASILGPVVDRSDTGNILRIDDEKSQGGFKVGKVLGARGAPGQRELHIEYLDRAKGADGKPSEDRKPSEWIPASSDRLRLHERDISLWMQREDKTKRNYYMERGVWKPEGWRRWACGPEEDRCVDILRCKPANCCVATATAVPGALVCPVRCGWNFCSTLCCGRNVENPNAEGEKLGCLKSCWKFMKDGMSYGDEGQPNADGLEARGEQHEGQRERLPESVLRTPGQEPQRNMPKPSAPSRDDSRTPGQGGRYGRTPPPKGWLLTPAGCPAKGKGRPAKGKALDDGRRRHCSNDPGHNIRRLLAAENAGVAGYIP